MFTETTRGSIIAIRLFQAVVLLYFYTGLMHLLGIFQYHNKDRLNWQ